MSQTPDRQTPDRLTPDRPAPDRLAPDRLERTADGFQIDAATLAALFGVAVDQVRREMGQGGIVTRVEKGEAEHAGTWRVTFQRGRGRVRLTVDDAGRTLSMSQVTAAPPPLRPDVAALRAVVEAFYDRVRADDLLGPLFASAVDDWPAHLDRLTAFWSSMMLASGDYKGDPFERHLPHAGRMSPEMFERWLALWQETTTRMLPPEAAATAQEKAARIARSLRMALLPHAAPDGFAMPV